MMTPSQMENFREISETRARSPLSGGPRFLCPECKDSKPLLGRKARAQGGFRCGDCAEKRGPTLKLTRPEPSEADVLDAIRHLLRAHPDVAWFERMNSGAGRLSYANNKTSQFMRFGFPGCPDIIGQLKGGRALYIEVKRPSGRVSPEQAEFIAMAARHGAVALVARSVADVVEALNG
jgi:VRR-NUC domain